MLFAFRCVLLVFLLLLQSACVSGYNLREGINNFRAQNYRDAFIRLMPEAVKGQPDAQYAIGYMYYYGQGVVEDHEKAWQWISSAAKVGQPDAVAAMEILAEKRPIKVN